MAEIIKQKSFHKACEMGAGYPHRPVKNTEDKIAGDDSSTEVGAAIIVGFRVVGSGDSCLVPGLVLVGRALPRVSGFGLAPPAWGVSERDLQVEIGGLGSLP